MIASLVVPKTHLELVIADALKLTFIEVVKGSKVLSAVRAALDGPFSMFVHCPTDMTATDVVLLIRRHMLFLG